MTSAPDRSASPRACEITPAPDGFRAALAELVTIGMSVARMVGRSAETEIALADAAACGAAEGVPALATSLAEAIEADRAIAAAAEARGTVVPRVEAVTRAFAQVSRAIRRTVLLAERLDQGWARPSRADDRHAMAKRQIARGVADAIASEADGPRKERLTEALAERLDSLDEVEEIGSRPAEEIIREICRDLGVDLVRMRLGSGPDETDPLVETCLPGARLHGGAGRPQSRASPFPAGGRGSG
jgi:hypothetical protein